MRYMTCKEQLNFLKSHKPDYVRVDYDNGFYEYLANDTPADLYFDDEGRCMLNWRNSQLLKCAIYYKRIKRMSRIPEGKKLNTKYVNEKERIE